MTAQVVILGGTRTPQAKAFGRLADVSAVELGTHAVCSLIDRLGLRGEEIDEVVVGNVACPADAANIARVIALRSGLPHQTIAHTVNRNCGSGMEAIVAAIDSIRSARSRLVLAGGTESMSNIPLLAPRSLHRKLLRLQRSKTFLAKTRAILSLRPGDFRLLAGIRLGLTDPVCGLSMGETAELLAAEFKISRQDQDAFALRSHQAATAAQQSGFLSGEITPMQVSDQEISQDVGPRAAQSMAQLARLRPVFRPMTGDYPATVTAGNSCPITDGATAVLVTSQQVAESRGIRPLAIIRHVTIAGCPPQRMGLGPVMAIDRLVRETGIELSDVELFEINEAFAAQVLACLAAIESDAFARDHLGRSRRLGGIPVERLNVHGGAIALGHPVGASGARIVLTLARALQQRGGGMGIAALCIGGGQGMAMLIDCPSH
ncbi:MAG: acetyl-CoA acetyltransferase [Pirellulaceae bacterium]|nr:MAG: acetyl-CoA acetyltransferase [Pirellulaceae bacterium]